ncbi:hypothetical protein HRK28_01055 [Rathayibacter sp. VKM Ac-2835]|uniref:hypothetical protein n=1 Tax=Rathayibacter sp. VKM Ac-2835 TaxID=2739043 RepID=UPI0015650957|nr:hypothetical protein [Rathayibacter sp. VKM Ac-2835]NRG39497.1 hypothetical protein [Rathayibacter sp. VKM Ac-2835]
MLLPSVVVAALVGFSALFTASGAAAMPGGDLLRPSSFMLVKDPITGSVYESWEVAPGIAVAARPPEGGQTESPQAGLRTYWLVRSMIDQLRSTEPARSLVEAVPDLLGAKKANGNRFLDSDGNLSSVRVLIAPAARWVSVALNRDEAVGGGGSDSVLHFDPDRALSYFDSQTGEIRLFSPTVVFAHELYHSVQSLAGANIDRSTEAVVATPLRSGDLRSPGTTEAERDLSIRVSELVTTGGARGLEAVKHAGLAGGEGSDGEFEASDFERVANPYLAGALDRAEFDEWTAKDAPPHEQEALARRKQAIDRLVTQHPTEVRVAAALNLPTRSEYTAMRRVIGTGAAISSVGVFEVRGPLGTEDLLHPLESANLRLERSLEDVWAGKSVPLAGPPAATSSAQECVLCEVTAKEENRNTVPAAGRAEGEKAPVAVEGPSSSRDPAAGVAPEAEKPPVVAPEAEKPPVAGEGSSAGKAHPAAPSQERAPTRPQPSRPHAPTHHGRH